MFGTNLMDRRSRTGLAYDALAGRRMPAPWALVVAAAAIGWAAGAAARAAIARMGDEASGRVDEIEFIASDRAPSMLDR